MGAHDGVTRICQPWEWSLSRSLLPIERRSETSYYHRSKISGSQQQGALAMTTATATKTAKKNTGRFILAKQQLWTCIMIFGTFLYSHCSIIYYCDNKLPNFTCPLYGQGEQNTKMFFFFYLTLIQSFRIQLQKIFANIWQIQWNWIGFWSLNWCEFSIFKRHLWFVAIQKFCYHGNVT